MPFVTVDEFNNTKVYALEDRVYRRVEHSLISAFGDRVAHRVLEKFQDLTLRELSANSCVDIMSAVMVL